MDLNTPNNSLVVSYLDLRKAVGIIGMALPFVLIIGKMAAEGGGIQSSISNYYHTAMRDVFVGSLCAIAVFLGAYRGYGRIDNIAGNLACVFALGVALFPTVPINPSEYQIAIGQLHITFAALLFLILAFFALFLFRKTTPNKRPTPQKLLRNKIYAICGSIIVVCVLLALSLNLLPLTSPIFKLSPLFWLESLAIFSFGVSWLVKGEAVLKD
jgi:hypothetical protein